MISLINILVIYKPDFNKGDENYNSKKQKYHIFYFSGS
ncbi:Uncharacterised protein [Serratia plymuthica]|nr:hypothetical protein B194_2657 [Serratia plymuthica A30]CAI0775664.1 Uncharacterised protein [Serratia plymuthica]